MRIDNISGASNSISFVHGNSSTKFPGARTEKSFQLRIPGEEREWNIDHSHLNFVELQKINDNLNSVAKNQRVFEKANDFIERMKAQLEQIQKQFPPFPPGSEDRVRALRSYTYFRNLIDQLTIPPPDETQIGAMKELINTSEPPGTGVKIVSGQLPNPMHPFDIQISS
jgi:hypothetical protein